MRSVPMLALAGAVTLAMAGCEASDREEVRVPGGTVTSEGSGEDQSVTIQGADGQSVVIGAGSGASTAGTPAFALPYPGADVEQTVSAPGQAGGMIMFTTNANPDTVIAYYQERAAEASLTSGATMTEGQTRMYGAENPDGGGLHVVAIPAEGASNVTVTWSTAG